MNRSKSLVRSLSGWRKNNSCTKHFVLAALIAATVAGSAASFGDTPSPAAGDATAPTSGDTSSPATSEELQEVTVTASKREETASRVGLTIAALSGTPLKRPMCQASKI